MSFHRSSFAAALSALCAIYFGCTNDFNQFEPRGETASSMATGTAGGATSSSSAQGSGGAGGGGVGGAGGVGGVGGVAGGGGSGGEPCSPVDDQNACTEDICEAGQPKNVPVAPGEACENGNKVCDGAGACVECVVNADCNPPDTCGGAGMPNVCGCGATSCADLNVTCGSVPNPCGGGPLSCNDATKNGTETDVDCGGGNAGTCSQQCDQGKLCGAGADCKSNQCTDGFCCNNACGQPCKACNVAGKEGSCENLPKLAEDPGVCEATKACDGNGGCKLAVGEMCNGDGDCASGKCNAGTCVL